jgi:hypothetical protein
VQSPRHVISELLQNADDADATSASVSVGDGSFVFRHDGEDFKADHFASLCRFGFSNKRALHTIGFRGIGFKSTFSLGNEVRLTSPTLSVAFYRKRFTQPHWIKLNGDIPSDTAVSVAFEDEHREKEISKNLTAWMESPASLLFFRSLRQLKLGSERVVWKPVSPGPVANSEWMSLDGSVDRPVLLIRSELEEFPEECVSEIRQERMLSDGEDGALPPCKVEIVLGLEGRLFVVLPTGVRTNLPFGCNAPFIQDPARVKIKDPETSPTNRWLLERAGVLAGHSMLQWLSCLDLSIATRAEAYRLLPRAQNHDDSIESSCHEIVSTAFASTLEGKAILLNISGELVGKDACVATPKWLTSVWDAEQVAVLFDNRRRSLFTYEVASSLRSQLIQQEYLSALSEDNVLATLRTKHLPKPASWRKLLALWAAVAPHVTKAMPSWSTMRNDIRIVPVQGQENLHSSAEVVRLGEKKLLHSEDDWDFLSKYLLVMNPNWPRYLTEQRRTSEAKTDGHLAEEVMAAERSLQAIGLSDSSDAAKVIDQVAESFFEQEEIEIKECVRLAQIAAALDVPVSSEFQFVTLDDTRRSRSQGFQLIADLQRECFAFAAEQWCDEHLIHGDYWTDFSSCTKQEWLQWSESGRSGLLGFIPLQQRTREFQGRGELSKLLKQRGCDRDVDYHYVTSHFVIEDWDFAPEHWQHWETLAKDDELIWSRLLRRILEQPQSYWSNALTARILQVATSRTRRALHTPGVLPLWLFKLRQKECLQDTWGRLRQPDELLRRTPETEALLDIEPFIKAEIDTESVRPLLSRLGVRDTPTGPDRLLERLSALSAVTNPPVFEVQKWCHRLDGMLPRCSTEDFQKIKDAFESQSMILTTDGSWASAGDVFLGADDHGVPGAAIVHEAIRPLTLWQKIGVEDRPTLERVISWLKNLPRSEKLSPEVLRRVKELLPRYAHRIWTECGCWLNLEGEWTDTENLRYSLSMHSLSAWGHLFPSVKQQVADFQRLTADIISDEPFSRLPSLARCLTERVQTNLFTTETPVTKPWMQALGMGLARIVSDSEESTQRIRENGVRLARTAWQTSAALETVPYLDNTPAGTARPNDVLWDGTTLYVVDLPVTRLLRPIARELAGPFDDAEIEDAIKFCVDRSAEHVTEYLEENFTLAERLKGVGIATELAAIVAMEGSSTPPADEAVANQQNAEELHVNGEEADAVPSDLSDLDGTGLEELADADTEETEVPRRFAVQRPKTASLLDRFLQAQGFKRESNGERYFHPDGRWIQKQSGQPFPWEMFSAEGHLLRSLVARDHCLARAPLQIASEIWDAIRKSPEDHSLIVTAMDGTPQEISGTGLVQMVSEGKLVLFPATYRVVCPPDLSPLRELPGA